MLDSLNSLDIVLFRYVNGSLRNPVLDFIMPILTDLNKQRPILILAAVMLLWMVIKGKRHTRIAAMLLIVTIAVSDQLSSAVFKHWMERPRPCHVLHNVHLLVSCGSGYSFPSSHAVNNFAAALLLAFFFPHAKWWFFGFASLVAFSRVYVGVHYPSDIVGGAVIGMMIAAVIIFLYSVLENVWRSVRKINSEEKPSR